MLKKYTEMEKRTLEDLGASRNELNKKLEGHKKLLTQIEDGLQSMKAPSSQNALYLQNHSKITDRVRELVETQKQEVDLAYLELQRVHQSLVKQYGKVRGLEGVLEKKRKSEVKRLDKAEQSQQDDLSARRFAQGNFGTDFR